MKVLKTLRILAMLAYAYLTRSQNISTEFLKAIPDHNQTFYGVFVLSEEVPHSEEYILLLFYKINKISFTIDFNPKRNMPELRSSEKFKQLIITTELTTIGNLGLQNELRRLATLSPLTHDVLLNVVRNLIQKNINYSFFESDCLTDISASQKSHTRVFSRLSTNFIKKKDIGLDFILSHEHPYTISCHFRISNSGFPFQESYVDLYSVMPGQEEKETIYDKVLNQVKNIEQNINNVENSADQFRSQMNVEESESNNVKSKNKLTDDKKKCASNEGRKLARYKALVLIGAVIVTLVIFVYKILSKKKKQK